MQPNDVISFWFDTAPEAPSPAASKRWWTKDPSFDSEIRERFAATWVQAANGELDSWAESPLGRLALIIVLDQFSRNLHRNSPLAWSQDARALGHTLAALDAQQDQALPTLARQFIYMPLEHAEDVAMQRRSVEVFTALAAESPDAKMLVDYAQQHAVIVERFGRFPHRNKTLGRTSTPEEIAFLTEPNSSF